MHQVTKVPEKLLSYAVRCKNLTVSNARTVLLTPEIYISQNVYEQLLDLLLEAVNRGRMSSLLHNHFWDTELYVYIFFLEKNTYIFVIVVPILMFADIEEVVEFLEEVITGLLADQEVRTFGEVMVPVFDIFQGRVKDLDLCHLLLYSYLEILVYFSRQKDIAKVWALVHFTSLH